MHPLDQRQEQILGSCKIRVAGARTSLSAGALADLGRFNSTLQLFL